MSVRPASNVESRRSSIVHGDLADHQLRALGLSRSEVVDFAVNINPYGSPPGLAERLAGCDFSAYPDRGCQELLSSLEVHTGVSRERLGVGSGAVELLWAAIRALVPRQGKLLIVEPTFSEARAAVEAHGGQVVRRWLAGENEFAPDTDQLRTWLGSERPHAVYLCQPNNPTGAYWVTAELNELAAEFADVHFILDEAFLALSEHHADLSLMYPDNVVRIRSLTKDLAIAGLRLGYALATPARVSALMAQVPPWSVSTPAQAAGVFGLRHWEFVARSRERLIADRVALEASLAELGLCFLPSSSIFLAVAVGDGAALRSHCLGRGVLVRDCASFGMPQYVRVCARPESDRERLLAALAHAPGL